MKWAYRVPGNFDKGEYQAAISDDQYKVYCTYKNGVIHGAELYDLTKDPYEENDLKDKMPEILDKLKKDLSSWHQSVVNSAKNEVKCLD